MDAKEVQTYGKNIMKALAEKRPAAEILSIIGILRKGVKADEQLLRSTKIGVTVSKLKAHTNPQVAKAANELVGEWRAEVRKAGSGNSTPRAQNGNGTASPAPSSTPTIQTPKHAKPSNIDYTKRKLKTDFKGREEAYLVTGNDTRDKMIEMVYDGLVYAQPEDSEDILKIVRAIELAAFNHYKPDTPPVLKEYVQRMRVLRQNLKNAINGSWLRQGLLLKVQKMENLNAADLEKNKEYVKKNPIEYISPEHFVVMTDDELKAPQQRDQEKKFHDENIRRAMTAQGEKSISGTIQCGKCKQYKVSYSQAQTRSADEPMTTFCECTNCGARWKM
ncbi:transcription elongation factor [Pseudovirgaria hyperparasitica]|uniref:Transcription elongation factor n=1 Tax=Pseudovirgaria hyperparasitica TaxID=470096 RepID=A0A6A6VX07_9PEZI|nr:transcription elongation factor [Pseudovirgaria hyperparasitica]KAF2754170.1 transcription elongation factor [Pseudovirgaria hyperparasitica]